MMLKDKILFKRSKISYNVGVCVIKEDLPALIQYFNMLHSDELTYYNNLEFNKRKTSYLLGRIAAKNAVSQMVEKDISCSSFSVKFGVFQFPIVKNLQHQNIQVSISHCNDLGVALAFPEEHPLGIDIERVNDDKICTIDTMLADKEKEIVKSMFVKISEGYTMLWTIKEALSKVLRTGMTTSFRIFELDSIQRQGVFYVSTFKHFKQYKSISIIKYGYACSIVLPKKSFMDLQRVFKLINDNRLKNQY